MALILIVDDSPTEVHVMKKALEKSGYQTATAQDGAEGVRMAREMTPDLIFMDVVMPGINGYQATRTLANASSQLAGCTTGNNARPTPNTSLIRFISGSPSRAAYQSASSPRPLL